MKPDSPESGKAPELDPLLKQLELVDIRMRHHITRFWALPSAYVGVVFIVFSGMEKSKLEVNQPFLSFGLILFGTLILVAMGAAQKGTCRYIEIVCEIETKLHLEATPVQEPMQFWPYYSMAVIGVIYSILMIFM